MALGSFLGSGIVSGHTSGDFGHSRSWPWQSSLFSTMERSTGKNLRFVSIFHCEEGLAGVKGRDERRSTAP
jgi:hypothetical protein